MRKHDVKHENSGGDQDKETPAKRQKGRPNQGWVEEDKQLFCDMNKETNIKRNERQEQKFKTFKASK